MGFFNPFSKKIKQIEGGTNPMSGKRFHLIEDIVLGTQIIRDNFPEGYLPNIITPSNKPIQNLDMYNAEPTVYLNRSNRSIRPTETGGVTFRFLSIPSTYTEPTPADEAMLRTSQFMPLHKDGYLLCASFGGSTVDYSTMQIEYVVKLSEVTMQLYVPNMSKDARTPSHLGKIPLPDYGIRAGKYIINSISSTEIAMDGVCNQIDTFYNCTPQKIFSYLTIG